MPLNGNVEEKADVVIVGGGLSGLSAAYELQKQSKRNLKILVLEAKERVGGRLKKVVLPTAEGTDSWDIGGQWVCSSQPYVMQLLYDLKMETFPQFGAGKNVFSLNNLSDIRTYSGLIPPIGLGNLLNWAVVERKINSMSAEIPPDNPLECRRAAEWDSVTLQSFADKQAYGSTLNDLFACMTRVVFGAEPSQISLLYFLHYCACAGKMNNLIDTQEGTAQQWRVKETAGEIAHKLVEEIGRESVKCGQPIVSIDQTDPVHVTLRTADDVTYRADYVIMAIPPNQTLSIRFSPELPIDRQQVARRMPLGHLIKFLAVYKTAFWRKAGYSGASTFTFDRCGKGPLCCTYDATSARGTPALVGFIGGEHAVYWSPKTSEERRDAVLTCLVAVLGPRCRDQLVHYEDLDWAGERYVGGCPVGVMSPGAMLYYHSSLRRRCGRLHWAGTESARAWTGYMEGAVEAGCRAACELLQRLDSSDDLDFSDDEPANPPWIATEQRGVAMRRRRVGAVVCAGALVLVLVVARKTPLASKFDACSRFVASLWSTGRR